MLASTFVISFYISFSLFVNQSFQWDLLAALLWFSMHDWVMPLALVRAQPSGKLEREHKLLVHHQIHISMFYSFHDILFSVIQYLSTNHLLKGFWRTNKEGWPEKLKGLARKVQLQSSHFGWSFQIHFLHAVITTQIYKFSYSTKLLSPYL